MPTVPGKHITLVEPFPLAQIPALYRWLDGFPLISLTGEFPKNVEQFTVGIISALDRMRSWAVEDQFGNVVGVVMFEPIGTMGGRAYVASSRKVWGKGWMEEAALLGIREVFANPQIEFICGYVVSRNAPARSFNERIGMRLKNVLPEQDLLVYEMTRDSFELISARLG